MRTVAVAFIRSVLQRSLMLGNGLRNLARSAGAAGSPAAGVSAGNGAILSTPAALLDSPGLRWASAAVAYLLLGLDWGPDRLLLRYATLAAGLLLALPVLAWAARGVWRAWSEPRPVSTATLYGVGSTAAVVALVGVLRLLGFIPSQAALPIRGSLVFRDLLTSLDADLLIFAGAMALGASIGGMQGDRRRRSLGLFCGCAAAYVVVANAFFLGVADYTILMTPDSPGYMYRNACRTPGYLAALTPFKLVDPRWLVALQLNLVLASQVATAAAVLRLTSSVAAGITAIAVAALFGHLNWLAFFVLSEPFFAATVGFATAATIAYLRTPTTWLAAALGLSLAAALSFKAVAPALAAFVPFVLLRAADNRRLKVLAVLGPPIVCLVALSLLGRVANGAWSPTNFGGYALAENVAWGIRSDRYSTDPGLSADIEKSLSGYVRDWPSPLHPNTYLTHSMDNLDAMFWRTMVPVVARRMGLGDGTPHCPAQVNAALTTLGTDAVRRFPLTFAGHAAVQFYGLWGRVLVPESWGGLARRLRGDIASSMTPWVWRAAPARWRPTEARLTAIVAGAANYDTRPLFLDRIKTLAADLGAAPTALPRTQPPVPAIDPSAAPDDEIAARLSALAQPESFRICQYLGVLFAALTLGFAALSPWIARLKPETAALALLALLINAYFAVHALFMFATPRYATCMEAPLAAFIAILGYAAVRTVAWGQTLRV